MKFWFRILFLVVAWSPSLVFLETTCLAKGRAEHVVVVVWDGMRPDFITPQYAPTLYALANRGVFFKRHHSAYISSTEVNGTALATGMHPANSGIMANVDYRPELGWLSTFATEGLDPVRRGDLIFGGNYVLAPTLAEMLQDAGMPTIIAGAKPVTLLHDRASKRTSDAEKASVNLFEGKTIPRAIGDSLKKVNDDKAWPATVTYPNTAQDQWTTRSLVRALWKHGVPKYTLLWLSEPDKSQHETGVGTDTSITAIESSDRNLAEVLKALEDKRVLDKTDVFVVSDHGFSTIDRGPNVVEILKRARFNAATTFQNPEAGDVMVIGLGGSASFYVFDRDEDTTLRLVQFLQGTDFAGVIFSRLPVEGTFPLDEVRMGTTNYTADVVISMRWSTNKNEHGAAGLLTAVDGKRGRGTHASLSRFDMRNTLVAAGPDLKKGLVSDTPSGNIDVVPTVLWILGVTPQKALDGRVLHEALEPSREPVPKPVERTIEATRDLGVLTWRQYLKFTEVGHSIYFDEGNGEATVK